MGFNKDFKVGDIIAGFDYLVFYYVAGFDESTKENKCYPTVYKEDLQPVNNANTKEECGYI